VKVSSETSSRSISPVLASDIRPFISASKVGDKLATAFACNAIVFLCSPTIKVNNLDAKTLIYKVSLFAEVLYNEIGLTCSVDRKAMIKYGYICFNKMDNSWNFGVAAILHREESCQLFIGCVTDSHKSSLVIIPRAIDNSI